jgi:hypothetical protein
MDDDVKRFYVWTLPYFSSKMVVSSHETDDFSLGSHVERSIILLATFQTTSSIPAILASHSYSTRNSPSAMHIFFFYKQQQKKCR